MEHGLAHLVELHRVEGAEPGALLRDLVEEAEDLVLLHEAASPLHDVVGAPRALEVARVGDLDEEVVDGIEAAGQLLELGQGSHGCETGHVLRRFDAHPDGAHPEVAPELEAEGRSLVLGAPRIEVGQREEGAAEPGQAGGVAAPALLGILVEPVQGGGVVVRDVLEAELAEAVAVVVDLHEQGRTRAGQQIGGQDEVEVVGRLVGGQARPAAHVHDVPDPIPGPRHRDGPLRTRAGDEDLGRVARREGAGPARR